MFGKAARRARLHCAIIPLLHSIFFFTKRCNFLARTHPFTCQTINLLVERRSGNTKLTSHIDTSPIASRFWHFQISILEHVAFDSRGACYITAAPSRWLAPSYYWIYFSSNFINIPWQLISPLPRLLPRRGVRHVPLRGLRNYQERWCRRTEIPGCGPPAGRQRAASGPSAAAWTRVLANFKVLSQSLAFMR